MDKLRAMQAFIHIAEEGSLTAAARVMASSLPAMVRTLAALEAHLGVRLLNRSTRRISLTDEGRRYLDQCRQVLNSVQEAEESISPQVGEPRGPLVITAPVLFGQMYVAPAVTRFVQRYPEVRCSLMLYDRVVNLLEEGVDVGIRIGALDDSTLVAQTVFHIRRVVVVSPDYLKRHGKPKHPRDLLQANCIRFAPPSGPWWTFHEKGKSFTVPVSGNLEFNNAAPAVEACAEGMGYGMFISYQAAPYIASKKLVVVLEEFEPPRRPVSVVYPHARLLPARTRMFIDWMKNELSQLEHAAPLRAQRP